jgi:hypothetical protein
MLTVSAYGRLKETHRILVCTAHIHSLLGVSEMLNTIFWLASRTSQWKLPIGAILAAYCSKLGSACVQLSDRESILVSRDVVI